MLFQLGLPFNDVNNSSKLETIEKWINKLRHTHVKEYNSAIKRKENHGWILQLLYFPRKSKNSIVPLIWLSKRETLTMVKIIEKSFFWGGVETWIDWEGPQSKPPEQR